jgi:hypothetical protein
MGFGQGPAGQWIEVELQESQSIGAKLRAIVVGIFMSGGSEPYSGGPRTRISLIERATGEPIHIQDWSETEYQNALAAKQVFQDDLRTMDLESFCKKYHLDWRPREPK